MKLRQLRKCRTLVPIINTQYMYMYIGCMFMCIYVYILHKYKKLATLRIWTNYKIVKYQIILHDVKLYPNIKRNSLICHLEA